MSHYNLTSVRYPVLTGNALRLFAGALHNPLLRAVLLPRLLEDGGLSELRQLCCDEPPTYRPLHASNSHVSGHRGADATSANTGHIDYSAAEAAAVHTSNTTGFCSARDLAHAYRNGSTTPLAVAEKLLAAMAQHDQGDRPLRAFVASAQDRVLAQAQAATARLAAGEDRGLFDGVPIAFKDELDVAGYPTGVGTRFLGRAPASRDATVVARLREAGAVVLGKTNMHEIGINPLSDNPHHGTVRNPYNLDYNAGGSSSGSAAAVAAGLCPLTVGADGGGSIRIPAALCGVVGLKATYGRISTHGSFPLDWSVGYLGPIGATVDDVMLGYAAMAGPDPLDASTLQQPAPAALDREFETLHQAQGEPLRLGVYREWFEHADPEIVSACEAMLQQLAGRGATIVPIEVPELNELRIAHVVTILSEMAASMANHAEHWHELSAPTRINLAIGKAATSSDYIRAQQVRTRAIAHFTELYRQVDVIVTPASATLAPPIHAQSLSHGLADLGVVTELMRYIVPGNMAGLPAITFPVGYSQSGLPIALQAMGRPWEENTLFRVAQVAERLVAHTLPEGYVDLRTA